jgi:hypothetical protein
MENGLISDDDCYTRLIIISELAKQQEAGDIDTKEFFENLLN